MSLYATMMTNAMRGRTPVSVFMVNGFQMHGTIADFDDSIIILEGEGKQQIIFRSAVSTITPIRPIVNNQGS